MIAWRRRYFRGRALKSPAKAIYRKPASKSCYCEPMIWVFAPKPWACRSGSSTDLTAPKFDFRFTPESGLKSDIAPCPSCANFRRQKVVARRPQAMGALLVSIRLRKLSIGCRASRAGMLSRALTFEHQGYGKAASHCIIGFDPSAGSTHITSMSIASFFTRRSSSEPKCQP